MKKFLQVVLVVVSILVPPKITSAAANITLTAKITDAHSITVTVKNNGLAGQDTNGGYYSVFNGVAYAVNPTTHAPENSITFGPITGGQSKDVKISNLNPNVVYSFEVQEGGGFYASGQVLKKINMTTLGGVSTCPAPKIIVNGQCVTAPPVTATPGTPVTNNSTVTTNNNGVTTTVTTVITGTDQCTDKIDNQIGDGKDYGHGAGMGDLKADRYGVDNPDGTLKYEPDPSCFTSSAIVEEADDLAVDANGKPLSIIPCTNKCTFADAFRLINNFMTFFIKIILIPIFIIIIMYAGYKYLMAGANAGAKADIKKMLGNIVKGIIIILCAWLIVHTIMTTLLNDDFKSSAVEFLGN